MRKIGLIVAIIGAVLAGAFIWLLSQSGPDNVEQTTVTIDIEDTFER